MAAPSVDPGVRLVTRERKERPDRSLEPTPLGLILLAASLSAAFLEAIVGILPGTPAFASLPRTLLSLAVTGILFLPVHGALYLATWPLRRRPAGRDPRAFAAGTGAFLGTALVLASLSGLLILPLYGTDLLKLALILGVSLLAALGTSTIVDRALAPPPGGVRLNRLLFAAPLLCALAFLGVWWARHGAAPLASARGLGTEIGWIAAAAAVIVASSRVKGGRGAAHALFVLFAAILAAPAAALYTGASPPAQPEAPDAASLRVRSVLFITIDTLRADALSLQGGSGSSTPAMDSLADDAVVFTGAVTPAPWTLPAAASLMTGLPPSVHGMLHHRSRLPDGFTTIAERMRDAGYRTAAIGSNPYLKDPSNLSQGFQEYRFFGGVPRIMRDGPFGARFVRRFVRGSFPPWGSTEELTGMAVDWLGENRQAPFFLWLFYFDPHVPYTPPAEFLPAREPPGSIGRAFARQSQVRNGFFSPSQEERAWIRELYDAEVRYVDRSVGRVIETLKELDLYDGALIILTSDHGEEFWEHGGFEHGHSLYQEVIRVPLLIKLPGAATRARVDRPVSTGSLMSTILDLCGMEHGIEPPSDPSLAPFLSGTEVIPPGRPILSTGLVYFEDRVGVLFDGMKYIRALVSGQEELYDLAADPEERSSVAGERPEALERARRIVADHERAAAEARRRYVGSEEEEAVADRDRLEALRSLGYVD